MEGRQERLNKVFRYLLGEGKVSTQKDFAEKIKMSRPALSAAMNGNESYLTENLMSRIVAFFPEISFIWLKEGDGTMLIEDLNPDNVTELAEEHSSLVNALLAAKDETIDALQREMKTKDEMIQFLKEEIENLKREKKSTQEWMLTMPGVAEKESVR